MPTTIETVAPLPVERVIAKTPPTELFGCEIVSKYNWDYQTAYAVCMAESGGNSNAANLNDRHNGCIGSYGLMQIACIHTGGQAEYNPEVNMAKAYEIYSRSGWTPWGAFTSGKYLKFLK